MIDKELFSELVKQNQVLDTPGWKTHSPWENKVLPNLSKTQVNLESANDKLLKGNDEDAGRMSGVVGGIGKDIDDFDMGWMDDISKTDIDSQLDIVVGLADTISRSR